MKLSIGFPKEFAFLLLAMGTFHANIFVLDDSSGSKRYSW